MPRSATPPRSLSQQFAWAAAALAGMAALLVAGASWWWVDRLERDAAQALLVKDTELHAQQVETMLANLSARLLEMAQSPLLLTALTDGAGREVYVQPYLGNIRTINAVPVELLFVDFRGQEIARNGDLSFSEAELVWVRQQLQAWQAGAEVSNGPSGSALLAIEMVVYPRTSTVEGALVLKLPMQELLRDSTFVVTASHAEQAHANADNATAIASPTNFQPLHFAVARTATALPSIGVALPAWVPLGGAVLLIVSIAWVGRRMADRLTGDLRELDRFTKGVTETAFGSARAPATGADEVASLARSVNQMLDRLNEQHDTQRIESEAQLRLLGTCISRLNDIVMITEADPLGVPGPRILFVNEAFARHTGYALDEVIGQTPRLLQGPGTDRAELDRVRAALERWEPVRAELLNYRRDGSEFWNEIDIVPVLGERGVVTHWVSVERDVTERREAEAVRLGLEAQLREAQKMEAIGTLAGGVAHDFNNILGAILGNVALARQDLDAGRAVTARLDQINRSAERARGLVEQILTFSRRRQRHELSAEAVGPIVEETAELLRATVPARVRIELELCAEPLHVMADATAIQQVLMNLATNAWHAMAGSSGLIRMGLRAAALPLPRATAIAAPDLPGGHYAHLWVADDGCGMDTATQARIFEPFYTTKPVGSGTGLGLSVVLGIVRAHQGAITVESVPGEGACFHVYLPLTDAPAAAPGPDRAAPAIVRGAGQRVLYVDDDEVLTTMTGALLRSWGYAVTTVTDGRAALDLLRGDPDAHDLVITDYNMPEMSGVEVLDAVTALRPDLPVVLTSGFLADEVVQAALDAGASAVVRKERLHDELAELMGRILAGRSRPAD